MRWVKYTILLGVLLLPAMVFADDLGLMRLSFIEGDVQALVKDTTDWTDAAINLPLSEGDRLWVPDDGRAELQIEGGVYVRGSGNTALDILTINRDSAQFYLDQGHIYINNRRGGIKTVQVDTPLSSLRSYDNSIMMIDVSDIDGATEVSVLKGYVYAENRAGATRVSAGNTLTIHSESNAEVAPIGSPDEWERWNSDRDRQLTAWGESSRYLPNELHEYSSDFDQNGQWDYTGEYGYVWAPTAVPVGWAPYSYGSWIWIRGSYVWIDYDPWGWAPCHYGRWVFIGGRGWRWVPPAVGSVYWGPGFVGWIVTPTYVAWVPLAPGEVYYGHGYYGPGSVNITTVNVNTVFVNRTYVNARVNNSVTVVQRETFGTGRREPAKIKENPFLETRQQQGQHR
ncbi:MAG TPA: FecR family protein, partial [Nitrospirota bacterium]|nr:FecR family protein [Nitrospirota bacterium]